MTLLSEAIDYQIIPIHSWVSHVISELLMTSDKVIQGAHIKELLSLLDALLYRRASFLLVNVDHMTLYSLFIGSEAGGQSEASAGASRRSQH